MNITIKGTHMELTPALKKYVEEKVGGLEKFMNKLEAKVELDRDQHHNTGDVFRAEATLAAGGKVIRAEASSGDMYASIDILIPKLKEQINKFKDKRNSLARKGAREAKEIE